MKMYVMAIIASLLINSIGMSEIIYRWDFNSTVNCCSNNILNTTANGNPEFVKGIEGQAIKLDSENYVNIEDPMTNIFTLICRIKAISSTNDYYIAGQQNEFSSWKLTVDSESGTCRFILNNNGHNKTCYGTINISDDRWHYIAVQFNNITASVYTDGIIEDSVDAFEMPKLETTILLGKDPDKFSKEQNGELILDDLMFFDHILPVSEIISKCSYDKLLSQKFIELYKDLSIHPIQLHRGGGSELPENTLETFNYTWDLNFIPEADIRTTADDVIVCAHDSVFSRIAPKVKGRLANFTIDKLLLSEVQSVDVGESKGYPRQMIPTLSSVFEAMSKDKRKFVFLDYKKISLERLASMIRQYNIEDQVIFTTKSYSLITRWKELMPYGQTMMWIGGSEQAINNKLDYLKENRFKGLTIIQLHYKMENGVFNLSDSFLETVQAEMNQRGIILQILPWQINDIQPYCKLLNMGITSFATDYPEIMLQALNNFHENKTQTAGM